MRVAVLGGGGVGVCAALEIARHGHDVDLYEQDAQPILRASRVNEGKIHQGILYAKDPSLRTARVMIRGALTFTACLARWIDVGPDSLHLSTPFIYAVHRDTMVDLDRLKRHFATCCALFDEMQAASGLRYLDRDEPVRFHELSRRETESILDPRFTTAALASNELSVDPRIVAERLRAATLAEPRITFIGGARVTDIARRAGGYDVSFDDGAAQKSGPYDHVVNALWEGRLAIDQRLGIAPPQRWIYRHKFGNRVRVALRPDDLPSLTMVLGPFGDIVNFGANGFYLSWYPVGMVATSLALQPPDDWQHISTATRNDIFDAQPGALVDPLSEAEGHPLRTRRDRRDQRRHFRLGRERHRRSGQQAARSLSDRRPYARSLSLGQHRQVHAGAVSRAEGRGARARPQDQRLRPASPMTAHLRIAGPLVTSRHEQHPGPKEISKDHCASVTLNASRMGLIGMTIV